MELDPGVARPSASTVEEAPPQPSWSGGSLQVQEEEVREVATEYREFGCHCDNGGCRDPHNPVYDRVRPPLIIS